MSEMQEESAVLPRQRAFDHYTRWSEIPMLIFSLLFLAVLVTPVLSPALSSGWRHLIAEADIVIWVLFALDYAARLWLAPRRVHFVTHNIPDLIVVAVPVLRPLRLARLARLARFARAGALGGTVSRRSRRTLHIDIAVEVTAVALIIVFIGAVGILDVERNAKGSNIHNFGDAMWWALTTVTTVGYGDRYPVTWQGKLIAAAIMITGIAVLGVITAAIAGWFVQNLQSIQSEESAEAARSERLEAQVGELLSRLARLEAHVGSDPAASPPGDMGQ